MSNVKAPSQEQINDENFNKHVSSMSQHMELPDTDMELPTMMQMLQDPNFKYAFFPASHLVWNFASKLMLKFRFQEFIDGHKPEDSLSEEQQRKRQEQQRIVEERLRQSEETIAHIAKRFEGFHPKMVKLMHQTPNHILTEMAVRLFVGSR